jgi:hypothetical protein
VLVRVDVEEIGALGAAHDLSSLLSSLVRSVRLQKSSWD